MYVSKATDEDGLVLGDFYGVSQNFRRTGTWPEALTSVARVSPEEADKAGYIMAGSIAGQVLEDTDGDGASSQGSRPRLQISESYVDSQHSRPT